MKSFSRQFVSNKPTANVYALFIYHYKTSILFIRKNIIAKFDLVQDIYFVQFFVEIFEYIFITNVNLSLMISSFQMCIAMIGILIIGWGPYGYIALWASVSDAKALTMISTVLPPMFAKAAVSLYPLTYILANEKFKAAYTGIPVKENKDD